MGTINLDEAKVPYDGQDLPAVELIGKLQAQLQEAASRMAGIASTLADIQAALLNANMIEVKLTLSKEDYDRFKSLGGTDDGERIRKAVMNMIRCDGSEPAPGPAEFRQAVSTPGAADPIAPPAQAVMEPELPHSQERRPAAGIFPAESAESAPPVEQPSTTRCPRCQSPIELPESSDGSWSVEIKCENCGVKYLVKSRPDDLA
jgi:DNA-directed RNA polymerase subunit RPC12/RpoP